MTVVPNVAGSIARGEMLAIGADSDASDTVATVVVGVGLFSRAARRQILVLQKREVLIHVQGLQQILLSAKGKHTDQITRRF